MRSRTLVLSVIAIAAAGVTLTGCTLPETTVTAAVQETSTPTQDAAVPTQEAIEAPAESSSPVAPPEKPAAEKPSLTPSQQSAVRAAQSYLEFQAFSRQGLIDQLSSEYGDKFPVADATAAVDSLHVNWNEQAASAAEDYLSMMGFSCQGLIDQLHSKYGDKFTTAQAKYGAKQAGIC